MSIDWSGIHRRRGFSWAAVPLAPCSFLYGWGVALNSWRMGLRPTRSLPGFVLSIGNLTAGGTGKTPAVSMIARWAEKEGYRPVVLTRGYGGRPSEKITVIHEARGLKPTVSEVGDEALLLARRLPNVPVLVSRDRFSAGRKAYREYDANFFILDDGFQHLRLARDLDLLLMDSRDPLGNGHLLPWGPLREPAHGVKRAHALLLTRCGGGDGAGLETDKEINDLKTIPVFQSAHVPVSVVTPASGRLGVSTLKERAVVAFCGIARPQSFYETLAGLGADIRAFRGFPDHHQFSRRDVEELKGLREKLGAGLMVTTEKDWMRLEPLMGRDPAVGYLCIDMRLLPDPQAFFGMIRKKAEALGIVPKRKAQRLRVR